MVNTTTIERLLLCAALVGLVACGSPQTVAEVEEGLDDDVELTTYEFSPMLIQTELDDDGEVVGSTTYELPALFVEANDYLRAEDWDNALRLYEIILDNFDGEEEYLRVTHYNIALTYEGLDRWREAAFHYGTVINEWPASEDAVWAHFRLAEAYARIGEYDRIPALMERAVPMGGLTAADRMEAHLRWAHALLELRDFSGAEAHYDEVLGLNERAQRSWNPDDPDYGNEPLPNYHSIIAQAHFGRGRVYHELFSEIRMVLPQEQIFQDMMDKEQLRSQAEAAYLDAVRTGNVYWAPAAGYMLARTYEDFYFDFLAAEIPADFDEITTEVYFEMLREELNGGLMNAMRIYENNLAMAYRMGSDSRWVDDTLASIGRIQTYLQEEDGWQEEEALIRRGRHPRSAAFTDHLHFRSDRGAPLFQSPELN